MELADPLTFHRRQQERRDAGPLDAISNGSSAGPVYFHRSSEGPGGTPSSHGLYP